MLLPSLRLLGQAFRKALALLATLLRGFPDGALLRPVPGLGLSLLTQPHDCLRSGDHALHDVRELVLQTALGCRPTSSCARRSYLRG